MVIKNLTCETQKLVVKEIVGDHRTYDMSLQPHSSVELDRFLAVVNPEKYAGIFDFGDAKVEVKKVEVLPKVEEPKREEVHEEEEVAPAEEVVAETTEETPKKDVAPDAFVCDICGAEFASARGLASHKNKAHAE